MRALVQRVLNASVDAEVDGSTIRAGEIGRGLLVLLGITHTDTDTTAKKMADKIWNLRAAKPEYAEPLVNQVVTELQQLGAHVETGRFRTYMQVASVNDGPTTVSIEI
ncbi:MAG: D-tyrosyl-tRNA(Tyr) deacylase [Actinobacteria bacterium]|nr:D-tyrosyl-tRNA(Tyr) deacylase [Actinomycetota bacterium]